MSEHEVVKHAVRTYTAWRGPKKTLHKIRDVLIEILIIVFAVSISVYLEKIREHNAEKYIAKDFLKGLQQDVKKDITELEADLISYEYQQKGFNYFQRYERGYPDSINYYFNAIYRITGLIPNTSRLDGLKYSGKLYVIENKELLDEILSLYQEVIPALILTTDGVKKIKENILHPFLLNYETKKNQTDREKFIETILSPQGRKILNYMTNLEYTTNQYKQTIDQFQQLYDHIGIELKKLP